MVVHRPGVALEALSVLHRLHFPLDRLVLDLAVRLAQPVTVRVDALLTRFAVLPHLVSLRHPGQAQAMGQDLRDEGFVRQAIRKRDKKVDWNDLHQRWQFEEEGKARNDKRKRDLDAARHEGDLLLAPSPKEKALLMYTWEEGFPEFAFDFGNQTYWAKFDLSKLEEEQKALATSEDHDDQQLNDKAARRKVLQPLPFCLSE